MRARTLIYIKNKFFQEIVKDRSLYYNILSFLLYL